MERLNFIYSRKSIRKFKEHEVPQEDIFEMIKAAAQAPSAKNSQNWHFVIIKNKKKINELSEIVYNKTHEIIKETKNEALENELLKYLPYYTFFKNAPVLILVFASSYSIKSADILIASGKKREAEDLLKSAPGIQNIGAAIENLLLAAANMGYGTCWMTGPNYAAREIQDAVNFNKEGFFLTAMVPLGVPEDGQPPSPARKPLEEIITVIE